MERFVLLIIGCGCFMMHTSSQVEVSAKDEVTPLSKIRYTQQTVPGTASFGLRSQFDKTPSNSTVEAADNFSLDQHVLLTELSWAGLYMQVQKPVLEPRAFTIRFYRHDGKLDQPQIIPFYSRQIEVAGIWMGEVGFGNSALLRYQYDFDAPIFLEPDVEYWVSIQAMELDDSGPYAHWWWHKSNEGDRHSVQNLSRRDPVWDRFPEIDLAFELSGIPAIH